MMAKNDDGKKAKNVLKFYLEMTSLKDKLRQGLVDFKIDRKRIESVAEHVYGVMIFAVAIQSEYEIDVDISKVIKMLLFHETEEVIIGDLPEFMQHYGAHSQNDADLATDKIFSYISNIDEYHDLVNEFNARETKEAKFAYMCDKFEHIILVKTYEDEGCNDLSRVTNEKILNNPKIRKTIDDGATTVSDIFFEYSRDVFTDVSFKEVLEYLETINTYDLRQES
jgi:Predicted hydrolases of HD superfamily